MPSTSTGKPNRIDMLWIWGFAIMSLLRMWLDRRWPGSLPSALASYASTTVPLVWFGSKIWSGYRRRRPHWTGESWRRYIRLAAMPLAAVMAFLALVYLFDVQRSLFGSSGSAVRALFILLELTLMLVGVVGFVMALSWMAEGEPSEQFTRTRWFRRGGRSAIAN